MLKTLTRSPQVTIFWLISYVSTLIIWQSLPTQLSQTGIIMLLIITAFLTLTKHYQLPFLTAIIFIFIVFNKWQVDKTNSLQISIVIIFIATTALGIVKEKVSPEAPPYSLSLFSRWALLGMICSEMFSFFSNWPISYINRSILLTTVFYFFYQLLDLYSSSDNKKSELIVHFIFSSLAVMVIIGIIIWINFPRLTLQ